MVPLSSSYGRPTDVNKLLADVLKLKQPATAPPTSRPKILSAEVEIAQSWQGQYQSWEDPEPVELWPGRSEAEVETVIRAVYRQVLGNAHVMESERLTVPESQIKLGEISIREFVRQVAKSELYRSRFFDNCPRYRAIELNFKHLLGRTPDDYSETFYHSSVLDAGGFEAEIDSYIDSDEYQEAFGENVVPFYRGYKTQTGKRLLGFTNMFKLLPSVSTSDKAGLSGNLPRLNRTLIYNHPTGKAPVTDINALLAEVLKPKIQPQEIISKAELARKQAYQALQSQCSEQETAIATLQQQLAELRATATIGAAQLNKWQSYSPYSNGGGTGLTISGQPTAALPESYEALQQQYAVGEETIASLREQIADQQRLAAIGSARLNKWRARSFS
ncbi:MAG: phycobilisome rod-core linker polypeptide [Hormoscilla sp. GUM202]|nr:phycobilisome rod-core linker polypeptide [Hormoscilla sp. GUM202]